MRMHSLTKFTSTTLPAVIGLGVAWLGIKLIRSEKNLTARKIELEIQLGAKSLKGL